MAVVETSARFDSSSAHLTARTYLTSTFKYSTLFLLLFVPSRIITALLVAVSVSLLDHMDRYATRALC